MLVKIVYKIFLILFASVSLFAQGQWIRQQTPVTAYLTKCKFLDTLNGWVSGDSGIILRTTNGGQNWIQQTSGINYFIDDIFFINANTGYVLANDYYFVGTTILKTTNGGDNWSYSRYPDTSLVLRTIYFHNTSTGYFAGYTGVIIKTTDGGLSWNQCSVDSSYFFQFPIYYITFLDFQHGVACGGAMDIQGVVWVTTNGGTNWKTFSVAGEPVFKTEYIDMNNLIAFGGDFEYGAIKITSSNGGSNWLYEPLNYLGAGYSFSYRTPTELWVALGFSQMWIVSTDGGQNWNYISSPDSSAIYDVVFKSQTAGWCVGTNGSVYKYNPATIGLHQNQNSIPKDFFLMQNFPNPFNPKTIIKFGIPSGVKNKNIRLDVIDVTGRIVATLLDESAEDGLNAGSYTYEWDASSASGGLASGIYFCRLSFDGGFKTMKMALIK